MRMWWIAAVLLVATPAVAADQFDLVCRSRKEVERYRVDLAKGEWCFGKCERVMKLAEATTGMITLAKHDPQFVSDYTFHNTIDRATGAWSWYNSDPKYAGVMDINGTCEPAEFSGLPAAKF